MAALSSTIKAAAADASDNDATDCIFMSLAATLKLFTTSCRLNRRMHLAGSPSRPARPVCW